ncbi:enoyl-CoA hydratase-related protein (plasmid) [Tistrella mobilis]|uniref:enoyl-CoA hydratase/isomerase family protein n=1 Tax=Tistrella mobilis TaxID=171437 RepID=UPI0035580B7C
MTTPDWTTIQAEMADSILTLTLNRPDRLNAFDRVMHHELGEAIAYAATAPGIRVIVLTGAGRAFSAGGDMSQPPPDIAAFAEEAEDARRIVSGMLDCGRPIVCRMNGDAIGLGATVALLSDVVIAADTARLADPHVRAGLVAGDGGALIWPLICGIMKAKYYLLTGDMVAAPEAERLGLVTRAVPPDDLDRETSRIVSMLLANAPLALKWTKRAINAHMDGYGRLLFEASLACEGLTVMSEDHSEFRRAFVEKRKAGFLGA